MSNGPIICCAAHVCCPPENPGGIVAAEGAATRQVRALGTLLVECGCPLDVSVAVAAKLMQRIDVVPAGLGVAIAEAYRPLFEHMQRPQGGKLT